MSEWKNGYFLDYIELNPKVVLKKGDLYPFVDMASVDSITRIPISIELKQYTSGVKFQELDTVFARIEPCLQNGKRFLFKDFSSGFGSTEFLVFRAIKNKTTPLFVYYYMQTHRIKNIMINSMTGATGRQRVNNDVFNHLTVKIPSLSIQNRIAEILSRYDSLIENYQKQIKLLEESALRLYKEWFVDLRFPGHENTKIVDGVPEGWKKGTVSDVVTFFDNLRKPLSSMQRIDMDKKYPYYGAASVMDYVDSYLFDGVYLLLGEDGTVITKDGYPILQYVWGKFWVNNHAHVLQGKNKVTTEFIYMMFKNTHIANLVTGCAQPKISQGRLSCKEILIPSDYSLLMWNNQTENIFKQIRFLYDQIKNLTEARDRLLPKLMSGEIEV